MCFLTLCMRLSAAYGPQATAAAGQGSSSGSFAFSRAAVTPAAPQQLGARMEQASVDPLGFFAADGGRALHRRQGERQPCILAYPICHVTEAIRDHKTCGERIMQNPAFMIRDALPQATWHG